MSMSALPFSRLPGVNNLFLDFLYDFDKVSDFYPPPDRIREYKIPHRQKLCEILQRQNDAYGNSAAASLIQKLEQEDTRCVITGQQVGLLSGPLYTVWKALTAIHQSQSFEQQGISCVPIFWMATEDHNLNEIASFALLKQNHDLLQFSLKEHLFLKRQPAGTVKTDNEEIRKILIRAFQEIKRQEVKSFYSGTTLSHAFARTLLWLLRDFPILIVDPSDPYLKNIASPFFDKLVDKVNYLLDVLHRQNSRLKERKYPVQVQMEEDRLPLFKIQNQERIPVKRGETDLKPETLSPSALLTSFPRLDTSVGPQKLLILPSCIHGMKRWRSYSQLYFQEFRSH